MVFSGIAICNLLGGGAGQQWDPESPRSPVISRGYPWCSAVFQDVRSARHINELSVCCIFNLRWLPPQELPRVLRHAFVFMATLKKLLLIDFILCLLMVQMSGINFLYIDCYNQPLTERCKNSSEFLILKTTSSVNNGRFRFSLTSSISFVFGSTSFTHYWVTAWPGASKTSSISTKGWCQPQLIGGTHCRLLLIPITSLLTISSRPHFKFSTLSICIDTYRFLSFRLLIL